MHCLGCAGREHIVQVQLPASYPEGAPLVTADLPQGAVSLNWQAGAPGSLRGVWDAHADAIQRLQDLFLCLDDLDRSLYKYIYNSNNNIVSQNPKPSTSSSGVAGLPVSQVVLMKLLLVHALQSASPALMQGV